MKNKSDDETKKKLKKKKEKFLSNKGHSDYLTETEVEGFISKLGIKKLSSEYQTIKDEDVAKYTEGEEKSMKKKGKEKIDSKKKDSKKSELQTNGKTKNKFKNEKIKDINKNNKKTANDFISLKQIHENATNNRIVSKKVPQSSNFSRLLMKSGLWTQNEFSDDPTTYEDVSSGEGKRLRTVAEEMLKDELHNYQQYVEGKEEKGGMQGWLKVMQSRGTSGDRMAAWVLQVQESNVHNFHYVDQMVNLVLKNRTKSSEILDTVRDLFLQVLLPSRKLRTFTQHPLSQLDELAQGSRDSKAKRLLIWLFEDALKNKYSDFLGALEILMRDNVEAVRRKASAIVLDLLVENPEEEKRLLQMLVNKLGDPSTKVSSNVLHLLKRLLARHAGMKKVVVLEVERLLYRSNVAPKAQFYAICFLSSLKLNDTDTELACKLLDLYFTFFKVYIKKGDLETKMLSALLAGINKTYTYARVNKEEIERHAASLYKLTHLARFNTSLLALMLLYQIMDVNEKTSDRFYVALYGQLLEPQLASSSKLPLFLNLLCKALKKDSVPRRTQAFAKRLLQVCQGFSPCMACSALYLLSEVALEKPHVLKLQQQAGDDEDDDEEEHFVDHDDDDDDENVEKEEDKEEKVEKKEEEEKGGHGERKGVQQHGTRVLPSWIHRNHQEFKLQQYDPLHRNPLYCRAELECTSELSILLHHYHPSVAIFAQALFKGQKIDYSGDPLKDFAFKKFLARFITKNPKKDDLSGDEDKEDQKSVKKDSKKKKNEKEEEDEVDDDEDVDELGDREEVDFGEDFKDAFKQFDDDINDELLEDEEDEDDEEIGGDFAELDEDELENEEDEEEDEEEVEDLFSYSEKDLKQMKWEEEKEKQAGGVKAFKRKRHNSTKKGNKKFKKRN